MSRFGRLLEDLNAAELDYVVVGGIAMMRHGVVRPTRDIDVVFAPSEKNVARIRKLIGQWDATRPDGTPLPDDGVGPDRSIQLTTPHGELDLYSEHLVGIPFAELRERADVKRVDGVPASICSLADLAALKGATGRRRDKADLSKLKAACGELPTASS